MPAALYLKDVIFLFSFHCVARYFVVVLVIVGVGAEMID